MLKSLLTVAATVFALAACTAMPAGGGTDASAAAAAEKLRLLMVDPVRGFARYFWKAAPATAKEA